MSRQTPWGDAIYFPMVLVATLAMPFCFTGCGHSKTGAPDGTDREVHAASRITGPPGAAGRDEEVRCVVTHEDFSTEIDAFYLRYLNPDPALEAVEDWPIVGRLLEVSADLVDAQIIANSLNRGLPMQNQPEFAPVVKMMEECAATLGLDEPWPRLFVEGNPQVNAYVTRLQKPHLLVLTSGLYELYKDRPQELKFIIGHELGHLKCGHLRCHLVGRALIDFIVGGGKTSGIRENYVAPLLVGQLLRWYRESEISADRAGLICVGGDLRVAKNALLRLQHQTHENVLPEVAQQEIIEFERERFVKIVRTIQQWRTTHPFISNRCSALDEWTMSAHYAQLAKRTALPVARSIVVDRIQVQGLPDGDVGVYPTRRPSDPYLRTAVGRAEFETDYFADDNNPVFEKLNWRADFTPNQKMIIEVLDCDQAKTDWFIGACVLAIPDDQGSREQTIDLRRDIVEPNSDVSLPQVTVAYHFEDRE